MCGYRTPSDPHSAHGGSSQVGGGSGPLEVCSIVVTPSVVRGVLAVVELDGGTDTVVLCVVELDGGTDTVVLCVVELDGGTDTVVL